MAITTYTPNINKKIHETEVDFIKRMIQKIVNIDLKEDLLPIVKVDLYLNGKPYVIPPDMNGQINWARKDRVYIKKTLLGCNLSRTSIYFEIDKPMAFYLGEQISPILELNIGSGESINRVSSQSIPIIIQWGN